MGKGLKISKIYQTPYLHPSAQCPSSGFRCPMLFPFGLGSDEEGRPRLAVGGFEVP